MKPLRHPLVPGPGQRTPQTMLLLHEKYLIEAAKFFPGCSDRETARKLRRALSTYRACRSGVVLTHLSSLPARCAPRGDLAIRRSIDARAINDGLSAFGTTADVRWSPRNFAFRPSGHFDGERKYGSIVALR